MLIVALFYLRVGRRRLWQQLQDGAPASVEIRPASPPAGLEARAGALCWILLTWVASLAFWVPSLREAYIYHFLPMYTFALVLLAGLVDRWYGKRPLGALIGLGAVLEVALFYAPLWGEMPMTEAALNARLFHFWR